MEVDHGRINQTTLVKRFVVKNLHQIFGIQINLTQLLWPSWLLLLLSLLAKISFPFENEEFFDEITRDLVDGLRAFYRNFLLLSGYIGPRVYSILSQFCDQQIKVVHDVLSCRHSQLCYEILVVCFGCGHKHVQTRNEACLVTQINCVSQIDRPRSDLNHLANWSLHWTVTDLLATSRGHSRKGTPTKSSSTRISSLTQLFTNVCLFEWGWKIKSALHGDSTTTPTKRTPLLLLFSLLVYFVKELGSGRF